MTIVSSMISGRRLVVCRMEMNAVARLGDDWFESHDIAPATTRPLVAADSRFHAGFSRTIGTWSVDSQYQIEPVRPAASVARCRN